MTSTTQTAECRHEAQTLRLKSENSGYYDTLSERYVCYPYSVTREELEQNIWHFDVKTIERHVMCITRNYRDPNIGMYKII